MVVVAAVGAVAVSVVAAVVVVGVEASDDG
jgi:hypothetical protein